MPQIFAAEGRIRRMGEKLVHWTYINTICLGEPSTNLRAMENEFASSAPEISPDAVDLDTIEQDLADVETALARLEAGTYWTCETTGQELPSDLLAAQPTARSITSL